MVKQFRRQWRLTLQSFSQYIRGRRLKVYGIKIESLHESLTSANLTHCKITTRADTLDRQKVISMNFIPAGHLQPNMTFQTVSTKPQKKSKPPPLVLRSTEARNWPLLSPLAEFAAIATSPQSPLVKETSCGNETTSSAFKLPCIENVTLSTEMQDFSSCNNTPPLLSWPTTCIWERIDGEYSAKPNDSDTRQMSVHYTALQRDGRQTHQPTKTSSMFRPYTMKDTTLTNVEQNSSFTNTSWSKYYASENRLGLSCHELLFGETGISLSSTRETTPHNEIVVTKTPDVNSSMLSDLDSAAHALSNMAKRKEEHVEYQKKLQSTLQIVKRKGKRVRKRKNANSCARRPMNAFMLFAKRYRLEITRRHPGKDNRAISVILGDEWKSLTSEDRKVYISEAKTLAEEHKRIYPDCWKRKRTTKVSSRTIRKQ